MKKYILRRAGPTCPSLLRCRPSPPPTINHAEKHCAPRGAGKPIFSTRVFLRKVRTAGVALLSPNITRTGGGTGPLLSYSLHIIPHMTRAWTSQAGHLVTRWDLDWRIPVSHRQHTPQSVAFIPSVFKTRT